MRVLIGYDGSEYSDAAIEDLKKAGLPRDSRAMVVSVADLLMSSPELSAANGSSITSRRVASGLRKAQDHASRVTDEVHDAAKQAKKRVQKLFPEWKVESEVMVGSPGWVLVDRAKEWKADLVVVGSQGRSALKRLFLGSVSRRVLSEASCSVRVVRTQPHSRNDDPPRIIIGVDGSPAAEQAIYGVGQRVWPAGTEVRLVSVDDSTPTTQIISRLPQAAAMINSYYRKRESRISAMLKWATKELRAIGIESSVVALEGEAKTILLRQAREWNADCIFVGTRDFKSSFERFRLGSVSTGLATSASCPVEVVRPF
ncbi:MAG: universal stress protein [Chloracidobacterium sp.]|nr:universal stress protein [Chloracidobacterium sp.]